MDLGILPLGADHLDVRCVCTSSSASHDRNSQSTNPKQNLGAGAIRSGYGESCPILHSDKQMDRIGALRHYISSNDAIPSNRSSKDNNVYRQPIDFTSAVHYLGIGRNHYAFTPSITRISGNFFFVVRVLFAYYSCSCLTIKY